jgi:hypothetical protein
MLFSPCYGARHRSRHGARRKGEQIRIACKILRPRILVGASVVSGPCGGRLPSPLHLWWLGALVPFNALVALGSKLGRKLKASFRKGQLVRARHKHNVACRARFTINHLARSGLVAMTLLHSITLAADRPSARPNLIKDPQSTHTYTT